VRRVATLGSLLQQRALTTNEAGLCRSERSSRSHPRTKPAACMRRIATLGSLLQQRALTTNEAGFM
jgi:hypothetical protein